MKKILLLLAFTSQILISQQTCDAEEATIEDLNSITKCSIDPSTKTDGKQTRQISVRISAPKKRYLKRRNIQKKEAVSGISLLNTSGIAMEASTINSENSIELKKENSSLNTILAISNSLSKEEIRRAVKFDEVKSIPQFKNCKNIAKNKQLSCFNKEMIKHIEKYFQYPSEAIIKKQQGDVWVRFIIGKNGDVSSIKTLGPKGAKVLDNEAARVVSKLPKFIPGNNNGELVSVKYGFPISFSLEE